MMNSGERPCEDGESLEDNDYKRTICLHSFSDLSHVTPATFVYLLKECYKYGTHKATHKFHLLRQQVLLALQNKPQPGPATFIIHCLYVLPLLGDLYSKGFCHLLTSSFRRLFTMGNVVDFPKAKCLAAQLFVDVLSHIIKHEDYILVKLVQIFDLEFKDVRDAIYGSETTGQGDDMAKEYLEKHIYYFLESQSYATAVALLERFSSINYDQIALRFLEKMIQDGELNSAEKLASIMGESVIRILIQKYLDVNMLKRAYEMIKKNNLKDEFPDAYHSYNQSLLKKLEEKGCRDVAEEPRGQGTSILSEYKMRAVETQYLHLEEFLLEEVLWIDEINGLLNATRYIVECKVIGIDCEWKPNYQKGSKPNKVSIMQIASDKKVFIFDLLKLHVDEPETLDNCFKRILHSSNILKLGYNLHCDLQQLSHSYSNLECFTYYEMLLDMEKLFKNLPGGLSGLAKTILGAGLNKTRRNSNWEQRPLSQNQIEYAALDAAVLPRIFYHVHGRPFCIVSVDEEKSKIGWKSHIVFQMGKRKMHGAPQI